MGGLLGAADAGATTLGRATGGGADGGDAGRNTGVAGMAGCAGTPASFVSGRAAHDVCAAAGALGVIDDGRCANGAGCAPIVGRGAPTLVEGRATGAGIAPGPCVGRVGGAGIPPGATGGTGPTGRTLSLPAGVGSVRAGIGKGA